VCCLKLLSTAVAGKSKCIGLVLMPAISNGMSLVAKVFFCFILLCHNAHTSLACQGLARQILLGVESQFRSPSKASKQVNFLKNGSLLICRIYLNFLKIFRSPCVLCFIWTVGEQIGWWMHGVWRNNVRFTRS
jgi:hypothetical protein